MSKKIKKNQELLKCRWFGRRRDMEKEECDLIKHQGKPCGHTSVPKILLGHTDARQTWFNTNYPLQGQPCSFPPRSHGTDITPRKKGLPLDGINSTLIIPQLIMLIIINNVSHVNNPTVPPLMLLIHEQSMKGFSSFVSFATKSQYPLIFQAETCQLSGIILYLATSKFLPWKLFIITTCCGAVQEHFQRLGWNTGLLQDAPVGQSQNPELCCGF